MVRFGTGCVLTQKRSVVNLSFGRREAVGGYRINRTWEIRRNGGFRPLYRRSIGLPPRKRHSSWQCPGRCSRRHVGRQTRGSCGRERKPDCGFHPIWRLVQRVLLDSCIRQSSNRPDFESDHQALATAGSGCKAGTGLRWRNDPKRVVAESPARRNGLSWNSHACPAPVLFLNNVRPTYSWI